MFIFYCNRLIDAQGQHCTHFLPLLMTTYNSDMQPFVISIVNGKIHHIIVTCNLSFDIIEWPTCVQKQFSKSQLNLVKEIFSIYNKILKNKTLIAQNLIVHCEITRELTQRSLVFHTKLNERITTKKLKKTKK